MEFSATFEHTSGSPVFSPDGLLIAAAVDRRLVIRVVQTLDVVRLFSCLDHVAHVAWSPDSSHLLCVLQQRAVVQVYSLADPQWTARIDEGPAGVQSARWSPSGLHILIVADFQIRMTIWSLEECSLVYVAGPKFPERGCAFSPDGQLLALAERRECQDYLTLYGPDFKPLVHFAADTADLVDLAWSPDGLCFAVWEGPLEYGVCLYSADGEYLSRYSAYSGALGIKSVAWSPSGQLLAIGSYDQEVRVLNHATWRPTAELAHQLTIEPAEGLAVFREVEEPIASSPEDTAAAAGAVGQSGAGSEPPALATRARFVVVETALRPPHVPPPKDKPNPKLGVGRLSWSADGRYLVTRNDSQPHTLWVWDMAHTCLAAVLVLCAPVAATAWDPAEPRLAVATGGGRLYLWAPAGASCVHLPLPGFRASGVAFGSARTLLLTSRDAYCCAYLS